MVDQCYYVHMNTQDPRLVFAYLENRILSTPDRAWPLMIAGPEHERVLSFTEAYSYCESATIDGFIDWRLPNKLEMLAIRANFVKHVHTMNIALTNDEQDSRSYFDSTHYWCSGLALGDPDDVIRIARCIVTNYQRVFDISRKLKVKPVRTVLE